MLSWQSLIFVRYPSYLNKIDSYNDVFVLALNSNERRLSIIYRNAKEEDAIEVDLFHAPLTDLTSIENVYMCVPGWYKEQTQTLKIVLKMISSKFGAIPILLWKMPSKALFVLFSLHSIEERWRRKTLFVKTLLFSNSWPLHIHGFFHQSTSIFIFTVDWYRGHSICATVK